MKHIIYILAALYGVSAQASFEELAPDVRDPVPTVVFDIDYTLCKNIPKNTNPAGVYQHSPETILVPYHELEDPDQRGYFMHAFFPDVPEMLLILRQWGWDIHFFSKAVERRNRKVVPTYLEQAFAPYYPEDKDRVRSVMGPNMLIFSRCHIKIIRDASVLRNTDSKPEEKKDLRKIGLDPEHSVLVDDRVSYAVEGDQWPPLCVSANSANLYTTFHLCGKNHDQATEGYDSTKNAAYIVGILDHCRSLMGTGSNLRSALRDVLRIKGENKFILVGPGFKPKSGMENSAIVSSMRAFMDDHVRRGEGLIAACKQRRVGKLQSQLSATPYEDLLQATYGVRSHDESPIRTSQVRQENMWSTIIFQRGSYISDLALVLGMLYIVYLCTT